MLPKEVIDMKERFIRDVEKWEPKYLTSMVPTGKKVEWTIGEFKLPDAPPEDFGQLMQMIANKAREEGHDNEIE